MRSVRFWNKTVNRGSVEVMKHRVFFSIVVLPDYSKAFDVACHTVLLRKLMALKCMTLQWDELLLFLAIGLWPLFVMGGSVSSLYEVGIGVT